MKNYIIPINYTIFVALRARIRINLYAVKISCGNCGTTLYNIVSGKLMRMSIACKMQICAYRAYWMTTPIRNAIFFGACASPMLSVPAP